MSNFRFYVNNSIFYELITNIYYKSINISYIILFFISDGFVIIECQEPVTNRPTGQLLLDYLTDTVLAYKPKILGKPTISPDSRHLVTLDKQETGVTLVVQEISCN